jgi:hypothetical protein
MNVRSIYKEIQGQFTKIKGIQQVLEVKYRQLYRRDPLRDKEIAQLAFLVKNTYMRFESLMQESDAKRRLKEREERYDLNLQRLRCPWFHVRENLVTLVSRAHHLYQLSYKGRVKSEISNRRQEGGRRSLSLFVVSGEGALLDSLELRLRLREYDIKERYDQRQLRGVLTHLKEVDPPEVERVIRRLAGQEESSRFKIIHCLIRSPSDLEKDVLGTAENVLQEMVEGDVKSLLF